MAEDRKHVAVSVSVKVTLTSNSAHVNSGILLCCHLNRIDHHHHPLPSKCSREGIKKRTGHHSLEALRVDA